MTNCSKRWRGLKAGASPRCGPSPSPGSRWAARGDASPGATSCDLDAGAEHRGRAVLQQPPVALAHPAADGVGGGEDEGVVADLARGDRLEPLLPRRLRDRALQLAADPAPGGWVLVGHSARAEGPPRLRGVGGADGSGGLGRPGTANIARVRGGDGRVAGALRKSRGKGDERAWGAGLRPVDGCARRVHEAVDSGAASAWGRPRARSSLGRLRPAPPACARPPARVPVRRSVAARWSRAPRSDSPRPGAARPALGPAAPRCCPPRMRPVPCRSPRSRTTVQATWDRARRSAILSNPRAPGAPNPYGL